MVLATLVLCLCVLNPPTSVWCAQPDPDAEALWIAGGYEFTEVEGRHAVVSFGARGASPGGVTFDPDGNLWGTFCSVGGSQAEGAIFKLTSQKIQQILYGK